MKPNKAGIFLQNAYAYVLFGSLSNYAEIGPSTQSVTGLLRSHPKPSPVQETFHNVALKRVKGYNILRASSSYRSHEEAGVLGQSCLQAVLLSRRLDTPA